MTVEAVRDTADLSSTQFIILWNKNLTRWVSPELVRTYVRFLNYQHLRTASLTPIHMEYVLQIQSNL